MFVFCRGLSVWKMGAILVGLTKGMLWGSLLLYVVFVKDGCVPCVIPRYNRGFSIEYDGKPNVRCSFFCNRIFLVVKYGYKCMAFSLYG